MEDPTQEPTTSPISPTMAPTVSPTMAPSVSAGTPTATPTLSDSVVYVRSLGCDTGSCNTTDTPYTDCGATNSTPTACGSVEYGWSCFLGEESECSDNPGSGEFNLGAGNWTFPYNLDFDDEDVIIRGQGPGVTIWEYTGTESTWIRCR